MSRKVLLSFNDLYTAWSGNLLAILLEEARKEQCQCSYCLAYCHQINSLSDVRIQVSVLFLVCYHWTLPVTLSQVQPLLEDLRAQTQQDTVLLDSVDCDFFLIPVWQTAWGQREQWMCWWFSTVTLWSWFKDNPAMLGCSIIFQRHCSLLFLRTFCF